MSAPLNTIRSTYTHFGMCVGLGGMSLGLTRAHARVGRFEARFRCLGGIDSDPAACRDFERLTGTKATCRDLFDLEDFRAYHAPCKTARKRCKACGNTGEPPPGWKEVAPADVLAAAGGECPDVFAWSPPCKGNSGLLNRKSAQSERYQALNRLVLRCLVLALEAFKDDPPALVIMENVPRIVQRSRDLLDAVTGTLRAYGYQVAETTHDCGELGGLAQSRKRYLLVARHARKVLPFLYEPPRRRLLGVGEVLSTLPMPDDEEAGSMHRLPRLQWQTWLRLALIEAGKDWRSLNRLKIRDGMVEGLRLAPATAWHRGVLGVSKWGETAPTITGRAGATTGRFSVADPRPPREIGRYQPYGVVPWDVNCGTITSQAAPGAGGYSVADPRCATSRGGAGKHRVTGWAEPAGCVIGASTTGQGATAVADPRLDCDADNRQTRRHNNVYRVIRWDETSTTVTGAAGNSRPNVADPRPTWSKTEGGDWSSGGHYGVVQWDQHTKTVVGNAKHDRGAWSVADPRPLPAPKEQCCPVIISLDGTRHRPFTTLELAALQGFPTRLLDGSPLRLDGRSDSDHRMRIGNAVPPPAFEAVGSVMLETLLRQQIGQSFTLSALPVWVQPLAAALSVDTLEN